MKYVVEHSVIYNAFDGSLAEIFEVLTILLSIYHLGATARSNGAFGRGSGPIFLANVQCNGLEQRISDCPQAELEANNCGHYQDAGVVCLPGIMHNATLFFVIQGIPNLEGSFIFSMSDPSLFYTMNSVAIRY